jgi:hypothetical protein
MPPSIAAAMSFGGSSAKDLPPLARIFSQFSRANYHHLYVVAQQTLAPSQGSQPQQPGPIKLRLHSFTNLLQQRLTGTALCYIVRVGQTAKRHWQIRGCGWRQCAHVAPLAIASSAAATSAAIGNHLARDISLLSTEKCSLLARRAMHDTLSLNMLSRDLGW